MDLLGEKHKDFLVISASRTKDIVRITPYLLGEILKGRYPVKLYRGAVEAPLDINKIGAVVLWTKDPKNLYANKNLKQSLIFLKQNKVGVFLQLTVTGFGGTVIEKGIPHPTEVVESLSELFKTGLIIPEAVKLRYDPIARFSYNETVITNLNFELFKKIVTPFFKLGVRRLTASLIDLSYKRILPRLKKEKIYPILISNDEIKRFIFKINDFCLKNGVKYSTCVSPFSPLVFVEGCIDGRWINEVGEKIFHTEFKRVTTILHNRRGKQRENCTCTFSYDISYSKGIKHCFSTKSYCVYCYSGW